MKKIDSKSKKFLITLGPILLLVLILSISYAYWQRTASQTDINKLDTLKCLESTLTDVTSAINFEDEYPIPNAEGMTKTPYTFKITNSCDVFIHANVALEVLSSSALSADYVRASLNSLGDTTDKSKILSSNSQVTPTIAGATSYVIETDLMIFPMDSISLDLRLWIDEATTTEQGFNKNFESKIVVEYSPKAIPIHLSVDLPASPVGAYNTTFAGASWNLKTSTLEISSLASGTNITLTNADVGSTNFADHIISLAGTAQGTGEVVVENGYRYEGKNPNNWVWFNNEYWRVIGVFDDFIHGKTGQNLVKLIRANSIGAFAWDKDNSNNWEGATLKKLLNDYYYYGINESTPTYCMGYENTISNCNFTVNGITSLNSRNMIEEVSWNLGGLDEMEENVNDIYDNENGTNVYSGNPTKITAHIGLMNASDYGYAVLGSSCPRDTYFYWGDYSTNECVGSSWLFGQNEEWFLNHYSGYSYNAFYVDSDGGVSSSSITYYGAGVRPSIYLKSNTTIIGGDGTSGNPYVLGS